MQEYWFTEPGGGTLLVRVRDLDATPGNDSLDKLSVDELYVASMPSAGSAGRPAARQRFGPVPAGRPADRVRVAAPAPR